jgi:hypothetical protein
MCASYPILCLVAVSGVAGFFGGDAKVRATDPDPCSQYECKVVQAYWDANGAYDYVYAFFKVDEDVPYNSYVEGIFTPTATGKGPRILTGTPEKEDKRDRLLFPWCTPSCGKSLNTKGNMAWQSPQEVVRLGKGWKPQDALNDRGICTAVEGDVGKKTDPQTNHNDAERVPPPSQSKDG